MQLIIPLMEVIITKIHAFTRKVMGCVKHKKDIMISFTESGDTGVHDLFLTTEQAEGLRESLTRAIQINTIE